MRVAGWISAVGAALALAACGGGGGGGSGNGGAVAPPSGSTPTTPGPVTQAAIEASQGTTLQRPVFQCGTDADTVTADAAPGSVSVFESGPVRPLALSGDGRRLYVANAPANCLEIYAVEGDSLRLASSVAVGLEPVAVAERNTDEVWVVNHLSDSVSVVRLDGTPRVLRTLLVGDEPRDIVFAGTGRNRAFVSAAFRGQNHPGFSSSSLTTPGTGRADIWVFDAAGLDDSLNGKPVAIVNLKADAARALAASADGRTVYAAPFMSGNRTTVLHRDALTGSKPGPTTSIDGVAAPGTGLIVKQDGAAWRDEAGRDWSSKVRFTLPDNDLFAIDATAAAPAVTVRVAGLGTTLFNLAVHPDGRVFASNTEARNEVRFEGSGARGTTVRGRIADNRISIAAASGGAVTAVHLNPHVDFSRPMRQPAPAAERDRSLAQPTALAFNAAGDTLYVAAFGSAKVAALPVASLTPTGFSPDPARHITVPDGPAGIALNAAGSRLFVYSRIAHAVSVVDTGTRTVLQIRPMFSPEAAAVKGGRRFLYDALATSSNGTASCASCHVFGDMDHLAWDLGDPDLGMLTNLNDYVSNSPRTTARFHPLKGPMATQTLRGMKGNGPLHWRGDRMGRNRATVRGATETLEEAAFKEFNPAFVALNGREAPLAAADLQAFTDFAMQLAMPPNPVRALDNSLTPDEAQGRDIYLNTPTTLLGSCDNCHRLRPEQGQFGTSGLMSFEGGRITENFKVPQLRNIYAKAGMFGFSLDAGAPGATGEQIRGFGFSNDGAIDTLDNFFKDPVFFFPAPADDNRRKVIAFVLAMDSDLAPVVGQQVTWRPGSSEAVESRLALLRQRAATTGPRAECDLTVRGNIDGVAVSGLLQADGSWLMRGGTVRTDAALRALATAAQPLTFTCLPPRSGRRAALDLT